MELVKETTTTTNTPQSQALSQFVEFSWKATRGLVDETETHVTQLVDRLVNTGKITPEEQAKLSSLVGQRMLDSRKRFLANIDTHVQTAVEKIVQLSKSEVEKLESDIIKLEQRLAQLSK